MFNRRLILGLTLAGVLAGVSIAGERGPGTQSGVVIFDRWDGCILYSGVYLAYVSKAVKDPLRVHAGEAITLDATDVHQPINPGDALIRRFENVRPAAEPTSFWDATQGVALWVLADFQDGEPPTVIIVAENRGEEPATLRYASLAPTLLARRNREMFHASDGPSWAAVTRQGFWIVDAPRMKGANATWQWTVTRPDKLPREAVLQPGERTEIALSFTLPEGEYDFLAGYGGGVHAGRSVASNLIAFDVAADGSAKLADVPGRMRLAALRDR